MFIPSNVQIIPLNSYKYKCLNIAVVQKWDKTLTWRPKGISLKDLLGNWRVLCLKGGFSSVQFSHSVVSDSLRPHELQHARPPCPSPTPGVHPNTCPLSRWCHPTILSTVIPFSSCPQSFPASRIFQMSQLFASGGQSTGVSALASVLPKKSQGWSPSGWTGWISLHLSHMLVK